MNELKINFDEKKNKKVEELVEEKANHNFTTVLANLYRNEKDSNGWHADNEKEYVQQAISIFLNGIRRDCDEKISFWNDEVTIT